MKEHTIAYAFLATCRVGALGEVSKEVEQDQLPTCLGNTNHRNFTRRKTIYRTVNDEDLEFSSRIQCRRTLPQSAADNNGVHGGANDEAATATDKAPGTLSILAHVR